MNVMKNKVVIVILCFMLLVSCSKEKANEMEWDNYLNKVWIDQNWRSEKEYDYYSFIITKRRENSIEGYFNINDIINPDIFIYSGNEKEKYGKFTGIIKDNEATCNLLWKDEKIDEVIKVQFMDELRIKVAMDSKQNSVNYYRPYSVYDQEDGRAVFYDSENEVILEKWGNVKLVSRVRCENMGRRVLFVYLTDKAGNILYDFAPPKYFSYDTFVYEYLFDDINKDGLKDLILILSDGADAKQARVYIQNDNLGFEESDSLFKVLNNRRTPHNQDVKAILDYLQEKDDFEKEKDIHGNGK